MISMRLGAPVSPTSKDPRSWISSLQEKGYRAAYCPVSLDSGTAERGEYSQAAKQSDIVIAEVGAWVNPLSRDRDEADTAFRKCVDYLRLADEVGALCCVNIAGNLGAGPWDGASAENYEANAFDRVVTSIQRIIDEAAPERTYYCAETMPWMVPDSVDSYAQLVAAVDRPQFGVHFDPVNLLNSPRRHFENAEIIQHFVKELGDKIISVHAKDQAIGTSLTLSLPEIIPGQGDVDYQAFIKSVSTCNADIPIMVEHLNGPEEYDQAVAFIREQGLLVGVTL